MSERERDYIRPGRHEPDCPFPDRPMCPACNGRGYLCFDGMVELCLDCHGTGHVLPQSEEDAHG